jgi:hypothetical protein
MISIGMADPRIVLAASRPRKFEFREKEEADIIGFRRE